LAAAPDDILVLPGDTEAAAEVVPERNARFGAGLGEPGESVTTVASDIGAEFVR